jgi:lipopolysaccharide/colanic/teichoic acid biosynthesis glycosyltransferase
MKRLFDIASAALGLLILSPILLFVCVLIWLQDRHSPFYIPIRVGRGKKPYRMVKLRSMVVRADASKVDSTANNDSRITVVGRTIRRCKLDEIPQLWNVLVGDMSLVGPRPNVARETDLYTSEEERLLSVRPGITDISSIIFADEGSILEGKEDPDLSYNQIIRPYKSRFGLLYVSSAGIMLDVKLIYITLLNAVDRRAALDQVSKIVCELGAPMQLVEVARRLSPLEPAPPPGSDEIVRSRSV